VEWEKAPGARTRASSDCQRAFEERVRQREPNAGDLVAVADGVKNGEQVVVSPYPARPTAS